MLNLDTTRTPGPFVTDKQLAAHLNISRDSVWRWARKGIIPEPRRIGPRATRFDLSATLDALKLAN